eukprot:Rmarinus@m.30236
MLKSYSSRPGLHGNCVLALRWSYSGSLLATTGANGTAFVFDIAGSVRTRLPGLSFNSQSSVFIGWCVDDERIAIGVEGARSIIIWDYKQKQRQVVDIAQHVVTSLACSPVSTQVAVGVNTNASIGAVLLYDWRTEKRKVVPLNEVMSTRATVLKWNKQNQLAVASNDKQLFVISARGTMLRRVPLDSVPQGLLITPAATDSGRVKTQPMPGDAGQPGDTLVCTLLQKRMRVLVYNATRPDASVELSFQPSYGAIFAMEIFYCTTGPALAVTFQEGYLVIVSLNPHDMGAELAVLHCLEGLCDVSFCPATKRLAACVGSEVVVVDVERRRVNEAETVVSPEEGIVGQSMFSENGRSFAVVAKDGGLRFYRTLVGEAYESKGLVTPDIVKAVCSSVGVDASSPLDHPLLWVVRRVIDRPLPVSWVARTDLRGIRYYYNYHTDEVSSTHPLLPVLLEQATWARKHLENGGSHLNSDLGLLHPLVPEWMDFTLDASGNTYYYNFLTGETSNTHPCAMLDGVAVAVQRLWRGVRGRRRAAARKMWLDEEMRRHAAASKVQACARGWVARRRARDATAAVLIQSLWRGVLGRRAAHNRLAEYTVLLRIRRILVARRIQRWYRRRRDDRKLRLWSEMQAAQAKRMVSARRIARFWRESRCLRKKRHDSAACVVQRAWRQHVRRRSSASLRIQKLFRGWCSRRQTNALFERRRLERQASAVLCLQRLFRGHKARALLRHQRESVRSIENLWIRIVAERRAAQWRKSELSLRNAAATRLQRLVRGRQTRARVRKLRLETVQAAVLIQRAFRRYRQSTRRRREMAALILQRAFRTYIVGRRVHPPLPPVKPKSRKSERFDLAKQMWYQPCLRHRFLGLTPGEEDKPRKRSRQKSLPQPLPRPRRRGSTSDPMDLSTEFGAHVLVSVRKQARAASVHGHRNRRHSLTGAEGSEGSADDDGRATPLKERCGTAGGETTQQPRGAMSSSQRSRRHSNPGVLASLRVRSTTPTSGMSSPSASKRSAARQSDTVDKPGKPARKGTLRATTEVDDIPTSLVLQSGTDSLQHPTGSPTGVLLSELAILGNSGRKVPPDLPSRGSSVLSPVKQAHAKPMKERAREREKHAVTEDTLPPVRKPTGAVRSSTHHAGNSEQLLPEQELYLQYLRDMPDASLDGLKDSMAVEAGHVAGSIVPDYRLSEFISGSVDGNVEFLPLIGGAGTHSQLPRGGRGPRTRTTVKTRN